MKAKSRSIVILTILFGYIILQFLWWEILLVRQTAQIINEKQKLIELAVSDENRLREEVADLHHRKTMKTVMIVGEGTVFLLLLLFGIYKIKQAVVREAELAAQQKNFFLSITHELKTPISATKLQLQTLQRNGIDADMRDQLLKNALKETDRLNALIDNVLFASRLESTQFKLRKEVLDLGSYLSGIIHRYYGAALEKGRLRIADTATLRVSIDPDYFQSVVTNLVDNAFKYSGQEGEVQVKWIKDSDHAVLSIADNGIGIAAAEQEKIFEKFYRVGDEETRRSKGTGLGLHIVQALVHQHGGKIKYRDNEPKGSIFEIRLPLS
jgi:signal transduction histidine kinase